MLVACKSVILLVYEQYDNDMTDMIIEILVENTLYILSSQLLRKLLATPIFTHLNSDSSLSKT